MKKNKIYWIVGGVIVLIIVFGNFYFGNKSNKERVIKIGATLPLTGAYSFYGEDVLKGMNMAIDEINSRNENLKLELIAENNKADATEALNGVNKFLNIDNVDVIFSAFTHITQAIKTPVKNSETVLFYQSTVDQIAKEDKFAFRDYYDVGQSGSKIAEAVFADGYSKVKLITEQSEAGDIFTEEFKKVANAKNINILNQEKFLSTETDFKTILAKTAPKEDEALVLMVWRHEPIFMKQLKELGLINIKTYHFIAGFFPSADTPEMRKLYEENSTISSWYGLSESSNKENSENFINKFKDIYQTIPRPDTAFAYDDVYVIYDAAKNCSEESFNQCFADNLKKIKHDGVGGVLEFDENGISYRKILLVKVVNGEWVTINN